MTRRRKRRASHAFGPSIAEIADKFDLETAIRFNLAVKHVEKYRRRLLRIRPQNDMCVITQKSLKDIDIVFTRIQSNEYARGYCALNLAKYISMVDFPKDPVTRDAFTSMELRRLSRLVPQYTRGVISNRISFWKSIFIGATVEFLHGILPYVSRMQTQFQSSVLMMLEHGGDNSDETISSFFAQATYLYTISKPKYRQLKTAFLGACADSELARDTLSFLDSICYNLFRYHDIHFAFQGERAVPILIHRNVPANLR